MKRASTMGSRSMCVQPTFLIGTRNEDGQPNFAPITWVSVTWDTDRYLLVISLFGGKKTKRNIQRTGLLSANLVSTDMLELLDYFGSCSGHDGTKAGMAYEVGVGEVLDVPTLGASRWVYECEVARAVQTGDSDTYFCEIKNVQIMESLSDVEHIDLTELDPVIYSGDYHSIGRHLGTIGDFSTANRP